VRGAGRVGTSLPLLALLVSCGWNSTSFEPVALVDKLRVLAVRAEPPDVAPGGTTLLSALVVDPDEGSRPLTRLWLVCDPDPANPTLSACSQFATARDPSQFLAGNVPGVHVVAGERPTYSAPDDALAALRPGSLEYNRGVEATVLLVLLQGDLSAARDPSRMLFAIKRIRILDPAVQAPNRNPVLEAVTMDGLPLAAVDETQAVSGATVSLAVSASADSAEPFVRFLPDGTRADETESLVVSWYASAGFYPDLYDRSSRAPGEKAVALHLPAAADVPAGSVAVWAVMRDARGGVDWARRGLRLAP